MVWMKLFHPRLFTWNFLSPQLSDSTEERKIVLILFLKDSSSLVLNII